VGALSPKVNGGSEVPEIHPEVGRMNRPTREETYMEVCSVLRKRSTCLRGKVGAILVVDQRIISTGYNGSPVGSPHCLELGCDIDANNHDSGCRRTIHAEANVIAYAARHGSRTEGSVLYCTHGPCLKCAQLIAAAGIISIVFETPYRLPEGLELLDSLNIPARQIRT
jgi:dCMP deaminase